MDDFRSVLVHLDSSPGSEKRLRIASRLAQDHAAQLTGLYAVSSIGEEFVFAVAGDTRSLARLREVEAAKRARARARFHELAGDLAPRSVWAETLIRPDQGVARRARLVDLLVLGQHEPGSEARDGLGTSFVPSAIIDGGRPALVLPCDSAGADVLKSSVAVVAWKNSRESARAVSAALPLLRRHPKVHVVAWQEAEDEDLGPPFDVGSFLELHGVRCTMHRDRPPGEIGDALLTFAAGVSADLLVMGCFGHWRAREWAFGGATRSILRSMTLPVLMAH